MLCHNVSLTAGLIYFHLLLDRLAEAGTLIAAPVLKPQLSARAGEATHRPGAAFTMHVTLSVLRRS